MPNRHWARIHRILHPFLKKGWAHWLRFAMLLVGGMWLGHHLQDADWLTELKFTMYQKQMRLMHAGTLYPRRTSLVLLDDDDYYGPRFQHRSPINRAGLASLLARLDEVGVPIIVVDFDLRAPHPQTSTDDLPDYLAEDKLLFDTIRRACANGRHLVLTSALEDGAGDAYHVLPSIYTSSLPMLPCITSGYLQLPFDMRTVPGQVKIEGGGHLDSLALAAVRLVDPIAYEEAVRNSDSTFRFGQFLTNEDYAARDGRQFLFSGGDLVTMPLSDLRSQLANRVVIVSGHWNERNYGSEQLVDMHASPGGTLPGSMLHANYIEALLDRTGTFNRISDTMCETIESGLVILLALIGALEIGAGFKVGAFFAGLALSILLTYVLLQNLGLFLDFLVPLLMIVVHTVVEEILDMRHQLNHARHRLKEHHG